VVEGMSFKLLPPHKDSQGFNCCNMNTVFDVKIKCLQISHTVSALLMNLNFMLVWILNHKMACSPRCPSRDRFSS
jgi:hypothetical protein